jgi:hypothetical protein
MNNIFNTIMWGARVTCLLLLTLVVMTGCHNYYKIQTYSKVTPELMKSFQQEGKVVLLLQGDSLWLLGKITCSDQSLSGKLQEVGNRRMDFYGKPRSYTYKRDNPDQTFIFNDVRLFLGTWEMKLRTDDSITLAWPAITGAEICVPDKAKTTASYLVPGIGIPVLVIGGSILLVAATSCPLVYTMNGEQAAFTGEIFGGAVYSSLERDDYLPLPSLQADQGKLSLRIANKLQEIQYINFADLWIIQHPANLSVLPGKDGRIHSFATPQTPIEARTLANADVTGLVREKDQSEFMFDEPPSATGDSNAFNSLCLRFSIPAGVDTGKLVIRAGNSLWGDFTYSEFIQLFGNKYDNWIRKQSKLPPDANIAWLKDQKFALMVYVDTGNGWKYVDYFNMVGPLGDRDMIMQIPLAKEGKGGDSVKNREVMVKLESGYYFWELDYAGLDCTSDAACIVHRQHPVSALSESGEDLVPMVSGIDHAYYVQDQMGDAGTFVFDDVPAPPGMANSMFLCARGYYNHVRDFRNRPEKYELRTFAKTGRFSCFSWELHKEFQKQNCFLAIDPNIP